MVGDDKTCEQKRHALQRYQFADWRIRHTSRIRLQRNGSDLRVMPITELIYAAKNARNELISDPRSSRLRVPGEVLHDPKSTVAMHFK